MLSWTKQILIDIAYFNKSKASLAKPLQQIVENLPLLHHGAVEKAYTRAGKIGIAEPCRRLFIFDYGGTLLHSEKYDIYIKTTLSAISGRKPTAEMMASLRTLCDDPSNCVMVITGLTKMKLGDTFKDYPNLTIVTSNGLVYSWGKNMVKVYSIYYPTV